MSKKMIEIIRDWLNNNKIFFETIAVLLLALMAIIVSWNTNQIASYQTDIMKSEHLPIIHLDIAQIYDPSTKNYTRDELIISNLGAPLSEFETEEAIFFKVGYSNHKDGKIALIPLYGYYNAIFLTGNATGELVTFLNDEVAEGNKYRAVHMSSEYNDFVQKRNGYGFANLVRYVRVSYKDIFGEIHKEFYIAATPLNPERFDTVLPDAPLRIYKLNETEGKNIFEYYQRNWYALIFRSENSSDLIYERWSTIINESEEHK